MGVRIVNVIIYLCLFSGLLLYQHGVFEKSKRWKWFNNAIKEWKGFVLLLALVNTVSFVITFIPEESQLYLEKGAYGEDAKEIPLLLQDDEQTEKLILEVNARQLTSMELDERVEEAFAYLKSHMQGDNPSLIEVRSSLDYSLDFEKFPFEVSFVSSDYSVIDSEGVVHNDRQHLLSLGYTEREIEQGIPVEIGVELWYGEKSFQQDYDVIILEQELSAMEMEKDKIESILRQIEKEAVYEEGFYIPAEIEGVQITRDDVTKLNGWHVLIVGISVTILLVMRELENRKKAEEERKYCFLRSYSWFINEMALLLGAGMQVRNILTLMVKENEKSDFDYRKPLLNELEQAVHSLELGMTEEQMYYRLGRNIGIPCYIKIMTLLEQNAKHGGKGLMVSFEQEELAALEQRKTLAKRYGEEAGTKLLGPMVLLLLVIMLMIMIPAFWSFA